MTHSETPALARTSRTGFPKKARFLRQASPSANLRLASHVPANVNSQQLLDGDLMYITTMHNMQVYECINEIENAKVTLAS